MPGSDVSRDAPPYVAGGPWILPSNRRIRHLSAISLRNLSFTEPKAVRRPGVSVDDEVLPQSRHSPAKLVNQEHLRSLEHSRSSTDLALLRPIKEARGASDSIRNENVSPLPSPVASPSKSRRRSTVDWASASPFARQLRLENLAKERLLDVFFSLHIKGDADPAYVSETMEKTMNPNFSTFNLFDVDLGATRNSVFTIKVWAKPLSHKSFALLVEAEIHLRWLQFIGKKLESYQERLPPNCVILHLVDGVYISSTSSLAILQPSEVDTKQFQQSRALSTSSYDTLMRLSTLDLSLQDAVASRRRTESEMNNLLAAHSQSLDTMRAVPFTRQRAAAARAALASERKRLEHLRVQRKAKAAAIARTAAAARALDAKQQAEEDGMRAEAARFAARRRDIAAAADATRGQRRRIAADLARIFPIEPLPGGPPLAFTIAGLYLPNGVGDAESAIAGGSASPAPSADDDGGGAAADAASPSDSSEATVAAALGHAAQLTSMLAAYSGAHLPYPLAARGSHSTASDPVSASAAGSRTYPLFARGAPRYQFEYAAFLLDRDVELLCARAAGVRVVDARHTLPNLKVLVCAVVAGPGEVPVRTKGELRAFLREVAAEGEAEGRVNGELRRKGKRPAV